jgi:hypothetical protein
MVTVATMKRTTRMDFGVIEEQRGLITRFR